MITNEDDDGSGKYGGLFYFISFYPNLVAARENSYAVLLGCGNIILQINYYYMLIFDKVQFRFLYYVAERFSTAVQRRVSFFLAC